VIVEGMKGGDFAAGCWVVRRTERLEVLELRVKGTAAAVWIEVAVMGDTPTDEQGRSSRLRVCVCVYFCVELAVYL